MSFEEHMFVSRRGFLRISAAGAALATVGCGFGEKKEGPKEETKPAEKKKIPIALQLYSVRNECEKDLPGVVAAVGKMGYEAVEFAGYYGRNAADLRALLDSNGLKCCGTHTGIETLLGDSLAPTIEFNKTLGNRFLIVPWLPEQYRKSVQAWKDTAKLFNEISEKVKPQGMLVGYHSHKDDFVPVDGQLAWDILFGNAEKDVVMQFDTGNALDAGQEALPFLLRYPGRAKTVHLKEFSKKNPSALIGEGDIKWEPIFEACETVGATEWYIVEYESDAFPPLESVKKCLENLRKKGK